ncbi:MAG: hypothetical protein LBT92_01780 [Rickettsiales bacterium]|jgi:hypothetical protein|nr:hypothetical protein [Rickettsiales bacterium]
MNKTALVFSALIASAPALAVEIATTPEFEAAKAETAKTGESAKDLASIETNRNPWYRGIGFGVGAGVLSGVTGELSYRIPYSDSFFGNRFGFRVSYSTFKPLEKTVDKLILDASEDNDDISVSAKINSKQIGAMIDFYPFGYIWGLGAFRLTGGYYAGDFDIDATITGTQDVSGTTPATISGLSGTASVLNGHTLSVDYAGTGSAAGALQFSYDKIKGPYAGLGLDMGLFWGIRLTLDAGLVFTDAPTVHGELADISGSINSACLQVPSMYQAALGNSYCVEMANLDATARGKIQGEIDAEAGRQKVEVNKDINENVKDINDSLAKYDYFPIVRLGLAYRF